MYKNLLCTKQIEYNINSISELWAKFPFIRSTLRISARTLFISLSFLKFKCHQKGRISWVILHASALRWFVFLLIFLRFRNHANKAADVMNRRYYNNFEMCVTKKFSGAMFLDDSFLWSFFPMIMARCLKRNI